MKGRSRFLNQKLGKRMSRKAALSRAKLASSRPVLPPHRAPVRKKRP